MSRHMLMLVEARGTSALIANLRQEKVAASMGCWGCSRSGPRDDCRCFGILNKRVITRQPLPATVPTKATTY